MTQGEITLGSGDNQFKVTDDGELTLGSNFAVSSSGAMTAKSGEIGGWKITETALESKGGTGAQVMTLGSDGSIKIGSETSSAAFEVTKNGVMKAANYDLKSGVINTALLMRGKMRVTDSKYTTITAVTNQDYRLFIDGSTFIRDNVAIGSGNSLRAVTSTGAEPEEDSKKVRMYFGALSNGTYGIYLTGATTCLYTTDIWLGFPAGYEGNPVTNTIVNGNFTINATSVDQMVTFPAPERIKVSSTETLEAYVARVAAGKGESEIEVVAPSANFATTAYCLVDSKGGAKTYIGSDT
jgi:hypothetical protein